MRPLRVRHRGGPLTARRGLHPAQVAAVAAAAAALDQLTKWEIQRAFRLGEKLTLIPGFFYLVYVRNPGVAFGLLADWAWRWRMPFFAATAVAAALLLWRMFRDAGHLGAARAALGLILGGAAGNLVDRFRYGEVVDFLDCWIGPYHWPTFNVADSCITVGTGLLLWALRKPAGG